MGDLVKVPTQLLNECLNRLVDLTLITPLPAPDEDDSSDLRYQPARPLNRITLLDFKKLDDEYGENPVGTSLEYTDPVLSHYLTELERLGDQAFFKKTLEDLLAEFPFEVNAAMPATAPSQPKP